MTLLASPKLRIRTDNKSLFDKCAIRRLVIEEAQLESLRVLDLYAGEGKLWTELRRKPRGEDQPPALRVERYTPIDHVARQPGQIRFKITPRLIAALDGENHGLARFNVVDVDCFGEPWTIWQALLFRITTPTAVFL